MNMRPKMYGRMEVNPLQSSQVMLSCSKCGGVFSSEKLHYSVSLISTRNEKDKNGVLVPVQTPQGFSRLCPGCCEKFKLWLAQK